MPANRAARARPIPIPDVPRLAAYNSSAQPEQTLTMNMQPFPREVNDCTASVNSGIIKKMLIHCILPSTGIFSNGWVLLLVVVLEVRDTDAALSGVRVGMLGLEGVVVVLCRVTGLWRCVARMPC